MVKTSSTKTILTSLIGIASLSLAAQESSERWYEVEIIVFKHKNGNFSEELWPDKEKLSLPENLNDMATQILFPAPKNEGLLETDKTPNEAITKANHNLENTPKAPIPFGLLSGDELQLKELHLALSKSSQYKTLTHLTWRQPVQDKNHAAWVRIVGGVDHSENFDLAGSSKYQQKLMREAGLSSGFNQILLTQEKPADSAVNNAIDPNNTNTPQFIAVPELDGAIQVYVGRYLHVNTHLYLREPGQKEVDVSALNSSLSSSLLNMTKDGVIDSNFESGFNWSYQPTDMFNTNQENTVKVDQLLDYAMKQSRRIYSGDIHYFDHPLFGLIIQVRPYEMKPTETN